MERNNATEYGGEVYVEDSEPISYCSPDHVIFLECFIQVFGLLEFPQLNLTTTWCRTHLNIHLHVYNNKAQIVGSSIYGGSLDSSHINIKYTTTNVKQAIVPLNWNVLNLELEPNSVSSNPFQVFLCENGIPDYIVHQNWLGKCIQVNCFTFLWLKLDREMELFQQ